jgi:simple sugar transport system substrate-binding protein
MKTYRIATVVKVKDSHAWFERLETGVKHFERATRHQTIVVGPPQADENLQIQEIEEVISQGVDALCVVPYFPQALEMVLGKARRHGIVVISHEAPKMRNVDYDLEPFDSDTYGMHLMDHLARFMGETGEYAVILASLMTQTHNEWARAAIDHQIRNYPKMNLATRKIESHEDQAVARAKTAKLLTSYSDLRGILGISMPATSGAGLEIDAQGLQDRVVVVGTGLVSMCRHTLHTGAVKLISLWDPANAGYVMNQLAVMALEGQTVTDGMDLGVDGYHAIKREHKVLFGEAMLDVTRANMESYNF